MSGYTGLNFAANATVSSSGYKAVQTLAKTVGGATWTAANHVVQQGDMITLTISNDAGNLNLRSTQAASIKIVPAYGSPTDVNFVTPPYYNSDDVELR